MSDPAGRRVHLRRLLLLRPLFGAIAEVIAARGTSGGSEANALGAYLEQKYSLAF